MLVERGCCHDAPDIDVMRTEDHPLQNLAVERRRRAVEHRRAGDHRPPFAFGKALVGAEFRRREQARDLMLILGQNIDGERAASR